jgi:hypothetical protein
VRFITFNLSRSRSRLPPHCLTSPYIDSCASRGPTSAGPLLIIAILLPQLLAQLRIGFVHCSLAQLPRHDVVIAAIWNIRGRRVGPAAATGTTTHSATTAALTAFALAIALTLALSLALSGAAALLTGALAIAASTVAFTAATAVLAVFAGASAVAESTAPRSTTSAALASNRGLLVSHAAVENSKRLVQLTVDLRGALASGHRTAAATTALRTSRAAALGATAAARITTRCAAAPRRTTGRAHRAGRATGAAC